MTLREWLEFKIPTSEMLVSTVPESFFNSGARMNQELLPIGMNKIYFKYLNLIREREIPTFNTKTCYVSFRPSSGASIYKKFGITTTLRSLFQENLKKNGFLALDTRAQGANGYQNRYVDNLLEHKFTASPSGLWKEAHRSYEAWYCKSIPIINHDNFLKDKHAGLPILWTWDYSEITVEYLNKKYNEMLDEVFDFGKIFLSCYNPTKKEVLTKRMLFRTSRKDWENYYNNGQPFDIES